MISRFSRFGLPLLGKELLEQSARKRTYVIRVVYASLLFFVSYLMFYETMRVGRASPFAVLGRGRQLFEFLVGMQFAGIYLFMPAITCSVITHEKERASLQLLFLTRLGPWTIVFEKLVSRLIPMLGFLLLSLPLLAYAYTLGGISSEYLWNGIWLLALAAVQTGTIALCCSAFCRTTVGAFIASYLVTAIVSLGPGIVFILVAEVWGDAPWNMGLVRSLVVTGLFESEAQVLFPLCPAIHFFEGGFTGLMPRPASLPGWVGQALRSLLMLGSCAVFFAAARICLERRAFLPPKNLLLNLFKILDRVFTRLNENRLTQGIVLIRDGVQLPGNEPVAWRETAKRSLGKARYLVRVFVAIELPVAALCVLVVLSGGRSGDEGLSLLLFALWIVAVLLVAVQSASLIAGERSHQTLDVLCTTPLSSRSIIRQKMRAVSRLMAVLLIPFVTIFSFKVAMNWGMGGYDWYSYRFGRDFSASLYIVCSTLSVGIYLPMVAWLALWIGLKLRTQARAIMGAAAAVVAWCIAPLIFFVFPLEILTRGSGQNKVFIYSVLSSPAVIVPLNEFSELNHFTGGPWLPIILNFLGYGTCLFLLRQACLSNADRLLGRLESYESDDDDEPNRILVQWLAAESPVS